MFPCHSLPDDLTVLLVQENVNADAPARINTIQKRLPFVPFFFRTAVPILPKAVVCHMIPPLHVCLSVIISVIMVGVLAKIAPTRTYVLVPGLEFVETLQLSDTAIKE